MNRAAHAAVLLLAVAACSGTEGTQGMPSSALDAPAPSAQQPSPDAQAAAPRDLVLELRRTTTDAFELERDPRFEVVLTNRSTSRSHPIVLSSDGSEAGWREPHVWYSVERRSSTSAAWTPAPERRMLRCGLYDQDWTKDVVALEPGKSVVLPWFRFHHQWELDGASHVRIVAHYAYGDHARDLRKVPPVLHAVPAYALASNAVELAIDPPLSLELTLKGPLPKAGGRLAAAVDVVAVNRGKTALPFAAADTGANLVLELDGEEADGTPGHHELRTGVSVGDAKERIAPNGRRNVVGTSAAIDDYPEGFRPRRVRAFLHLWWYTDEAAVSADERVARSPWVDVK